MSSKTFKNGNTEKLTENIFILIDFISFKYSMLSKVKKKMEATLVRTMMPTRLNGHMGFNDRLLVRRAHE